MSQAKINILGVTLYVFSCMCNGIFAQGTDEENFCNLIDKYVKTENQNEVIENAKIKSCELKFEVVNQRNRWSTYEGMVQDKYISEYRIPLKTNLEAIYYGNGKIFFPSNTIKKQNYVVEYRNTWKRPLLYEELDCLHVQDDDSTTALLIIKKLKKMSADCGAKPTKKILIKK